jgi:hypothetical protein
MRALIALFTPSSMVRDVVPASHLRFTLRMA